MIIISQDKETIFNFENIEFIEIAENKTTIRCQCKIDLNCWLGNYKTLERAKEILQEIEKTYSSYLSLSGGPAIMQGQMDIQPNIFNIPKVYKMPEE